jgi:hypothetical protein
MTPFSGYKHPRTEPWDSPISDYPSDNGAQSSPEGAPNEGTSRQELTSAMQQKTDENGPLQHLSGGTE